MKKKLFILFLLAAVVLPASAKNTFVPDETIKAKLIQKVEQEKNKHLLKPLSDQEVNTLRTLFMRQFDLKEAQLRQQIQDLQQAGTTRKPLDELINTLPTHVLKKGLNFYKLQKYTMAQVSDMYYAQTIPPYIKDLGEFLEKNYPQDLLDDLHYLRNNIIPPAPYAYLLPADQSIALSVPQTYLLVQILLKTNEALELEDIE